MPKKIDRRNASEKELEELLQDQALKAKRYRNCSHSFNDEGRCEYCGIDAEYFSNHDGDDLGKYE